MAGMQLSGLASGMDTESIIKDLMKIEKKKVDKVDKQKIKLEMKQEVWEEMNAKLYSFYTKQVFDFKSSGSYKIKGATNSHESLLGVSASSSAVAGVHKIKVTQLAQAAHLYSNTIAIDTVKTTDIVSFEISDGTGDPVKIDLDKDATISDLVKAINDKDLDIEASYDSVNKRILLNNTKLGETSRIQISKVDTPAEQAFFSAIGLAVNAGTGNLNDDDLGVLGAKGEKSIYEYNGMQLEAQSNTVSVNGLTITLKAESAQEVTVNVTNNTDAVYKKVKDFIKAYNELFAEMTKKNEAGPAKGYEPLTDGEKESLDDKTIEKWEQKIKDSILRRDDVLTSISRNMRDIMTSSSGVDTTKLPKGFKFLTDLGIVTGNYTEKGKLHIEGDEEDSLYALKENKLKKAIEENPDEVAQLLTAVGSQMYSMMNEKMKSTSMRSALTFYNDKEMKKQITAYEDRISLLQERMDAMQDRYYKQFTAMEQAIQKANSQSSSFAGMFGGQK